MQLELIYSSEEYEMSLSKTLSPQYEALQCTIHCSQHKGTI